MKRTFLLLLLVAAVIAGQTYRYPIQYSGGAVSHADADGYRHVPRTLGTGNGNCLLTHGASGDAYWGACPGASGGLDSAHVSALINDSLDANNHGWVTITGHVDSARVAGLSDSAKALIRYARTTAVHDTADVLRTYSRDRIHDSLGVLRAASTLQAAYNVSTSPQIVTTTPLGAMAVRRGSAADADNVFAVQNGAGSVTAAIRGNGDLSASSATIGSSTAMLKRVAGALTDAIAGTDFVAPASLGSYVLKAGDAMTGGLSIGLSGTTPEPVSIALPLSLSTADYCNIIAKTTSATKASAIGFLTGAGPTNWGFGKRDDALSGSPIGSLQIWDNSTSQFWMTQSLASFRVDLETTGRLRYSGGIFQDLVQSSAVTALYASSVIPGSGTTYNYGLALTKNGADTYLNGTTSSHLAVNGAYVIRATAPGAAVIGTLSSTGNFTAPSATIGSSTAMLKRVAGVLTDAVAADLPGGPYLPIAGGTVTGALGVNGLATLAGLATGGIVKAGAGTGTLALATSANIQTAISPDLWIGAPNGRGLNSVGFGNLATGTGLWGWAVAQDADGASFVNAPTGKTISLTVGGLQQGYVDYLGLHSTALTSTDVTSTNGTTSNSMINTQDRRAYSTLTATAAASPGYGPDIVNITGPAHSLAPAPNGSTYRQYRMPTATGKSGVIIYLVMGVSGPVNAPYLLAYTGQSIHEKSNGTVVGTDTTPYIRSGSIALISDGTDWWEY